jgi:hypothetical protein
MLAVAEAEGAKIHIKFNPSKSQLLVFPPRGHHHLRPSAPLQFCGALVPLSADAVHLGHYISQSRDDAPKLSANDLTRRTNILVAKFGHCSLPVKYQLFKTQCMAVYGSTLWSIADADAFFCAWRKCIRRLLNLPPTTHCELLPSIVCDLPPQEQLHRRLLRFLHSCAHSTNDIVRRALKEVIKGSRSPTSDSLSDMCGRFRLDRLDLPDKLKKIHEPNPAGQAVRDFILLRDSTRDADLDWIIAHLATN